MYEAYFNLKERPFSISPDPRFFYLTAQHKEALTNCQYMITNRVGPVYVHGDVGTGKTTIARRLYQQLLDDPHYILAMIIPTATLLEHTSLCQGFMGTSKVVSLVAGDRKIVILRGQFWAMPSSVAVGIMARQCLLDRQCRAATVFAGQA